MSDLAYKISVMQAALEGKKIQTRLLDNVGQAYGPWYDSADPAWEWCHYDYRIAPEPRKPRELYVRIAPASCGCHMVHERVGINERCDYMLVREVIEE